MNYPILTKKYHFCASHKYGNDSWTEEKNWEVFGKCNNPNGHGHNYHVQVEVAAPVDGSFSRQLLDELVDEHVVERFDHKYLNLDCDEFAHRTPTVENIAIVCHDLLVDPIASAGARLHHRLGGPVLQRGLGRLGRQPQLGVRLAVEGLRVGPRLRGGVACV